jgi:hypothetical protein
MRSTRRILLIAAWVLGVGACANDAAECVPGDLIQCRCVADNTWGYRTCDRAGRYSGACDCIVGLSPDAGRIVGYTSGSGGSGALDAGRD